MMTNFAQANIRRLSEFNFKNQSFASQTLLNHYFDINKILLK